MRRILLLALMAPFCAAQTIEVESLFQPAPLSGLWKHHTGDDPRWADPAFDDSAWPSVRMPEGAIEPGSGFSWYRFRVRLPWNMPKEPLALMIGAFGSGEAYEVFWNGQRAGWVGEMEGGLLGLQLPRPKAFPVPGNNRDAVIAIRLRTATFPYIYRLSLANRISWIGTHQPIDVMVEAWQGERLQGRLAQLLLAASVVVPGFFFLFLPLWRGDSPEYFWFGLFLVNATVVRVDNIYPEAFAIRTSLVSVWFNVLLNTLFTAGWVGLVATLFHSRISLLVWLAALTSMGLNAGPLLFVITGGSLPSALPMATATAQFACLGFIYYELSWRTSQLRERMPAVHLAILAYLLSHLVIYGLMAAYNSEVVQVQGALIRTGILLLFAFAMAVLMNQRSARLLSERQRLSQEMDSAAEVQSLMLTALPANSDAYRIETVYLPASEVGGDFYQVLDRHDGSRVVLVGDVSGKGLKAAMLVSATIGMLRRESSSSPGLILAGLNDGLAGHTGGGFVTCCCARFDSDGTVTITNAGHPAPYCDGHELDVEAGLPLGIVPGLQYAEFVTQGEHFSLVSDGVVEAENTHRELFGFDRTREISGQSAQAIAQAAKAWGQNDDITVVTVRRLA